MTLTVTAAHDSIKDLTNRQPDAHTVFAAAGGEVGSDDRFGFIAGRTYMLNGLNA